jgi:hypothetical protein
MIEEALRDSEVEVQQIKEKWGEMRCYCTLPTKRAQHQYRAAYEKIHKKYPDLATYTLGAADHHEVLKGIVAEEDCKHEQWMTRYSTGEQTCCVCGKTRQKGEVDEKG